MNMTIPRVFALLFFLSVCGRAQAPRHPTMLGGELAFSFQLGPGVMTPLIERTRVLPLFKSQFIRLRRLRGEIVRVIVLAAHVFPPDSGSPILVRMTPENPQAARVHKV